MNGKKKEKFKIIKMKGGIVMQYKKNTARAVKIQDEIRAKHKNSKINLADIIRKMRDERYGPNR